MVRHSPTRFLLAAWILLGAALPGQALQLGEAKQQILARHGEPGAEDRANNIAIYFWSGWSAELQYRDGRTEKLTYRRSTPLEEAEIASLLQSNGGAPQWQEITPSGSAIRQWVRGMDGATASCMVTRPLTMTFLVGQRFASSAGAATAPAGRPAIATTPASAPVPAPALPPPTFPKLLGSAEDTEPEAPKAETPAPTATALTPLRSFPKLPAEELPTEPPVRNGAPQNQPGGTASADASAPAPAIPSDRRETDLRDNRPAPLPEEPSSGLGWLIGLVLAAAAVAVGAFFWSKRRAAREESSATPWFPSAPTPTPATSESRPSAPRVERPATVVAATPALDALRNDQYDLLVGEIFRREGYTVELSGAAASGDSIDLTLRRDSETILVQCKYWKMSRVTEKEVAEFHGAMMTNGAPRGIFVTSGVFSREAQEFANGKEIDLMDRTALEECAAAVARPGENFCGITDWIGEFVESARIFDPECPICQGSMVIRNHRANGAPAWTCRSHPRCPGRREARLDLIPVSSAS